ncbi:MAG: xylulokinase, partial [Caldilinea sp.]|nr:xylulokinase [Caldilinea sp.]
MSDHLLGIDLGTSSVKVLLATVDGAVVASASADYPIDQPQPGRAEQAPDAWWRATVGAMSGIHSEAPGARIAAIGLSGQMHG